MDKISIAVIGLGMIFPIHAPCRLGASRIKARENIGPAGLTALKSLREEGFNATAFERRDKVGGLWSYSNNTTFTTVLDEMVCNISKFVVSEARQMTAI